MKKIKINPDAIISITAYDEVLSEKWTYVPTKRRKRLWGLLPSVIIPAHYDLDGYKYTIDDIRRHYYKDRMSVKVIKRDIFIYRKPYVRILTVGDRYCREYDTFFDSYQHAIDYQQKISTINGITVNVQG